MGYIGFNPEGSASTGENREITVGLNIENKFGEFITEQYRVRLTDRNIIEIWHLFKESELPEDRMLSFDLKNELQQMGFTSDYIDAIRFKNIMINKKSDHTLFRNVPAGLLEQGELTITFMPAESRCYVQYILYDVLSVPQIIDSGNGISIPQDLNYHYPLFWSQTDRYGRGRMIVIT